MFPVNPGYIYKNGAVQIYSPVNIEGAVVGPASSIAGHIATFSGSDGTTIQDSGYTTASFAAATHTHSFASLSDTPTTLSGYGITDAATSTHTHGNLTNDGKIGSTSDYAVVTGTGGAITAKSIAVAEPTASGNTTTFIATLSQKSDGQIVLTKKTIPNASTSTAGIVQLGTGATNAAAGNHDHDSTYLKLAGGTMTGTLTLAADPTASMQAATKQYVDNSFAANDAMVFKGTIGPSGSTVTALPASHSAGDTYRVNVSATTSYAGVACENGDLIICITDGTSANNAHWTVVQTNIDGAVTGPASATGDRIATFNGTSGKVIKDSGYTTASFAASTHSHGDISSSGTVSTTAVTATNGDYILITDSSNSHKVQRGIAIGTTTTSFLANDGTWKTPVDNNTITSWYGTSATTSNTAAKTATCTNYVLNTGNLIGILFTTSNTAATPTLNVNSTGAKNIYVGNATANTTTNVLMWSANTMVFFLYDGTQYRYMGAMAAGNVEQPRGANTWYGTSNTASTTTAKASTVNNFVLTKGATVAVNFSTANTVTNTAITLNINSTGAKNIYNNNAVTSATNTVTWDANETLTFMYDGTGYHLVSRSRVASGIIMRTWTA